MRDLTDAERAEVQRMTDAVAKTFTTRKKKADGANGEGEAALTFSGDVTFSDTGNGNDKADFSLDEANCYPAYDGLQKVRRVVEDAKAKSDALKYAEARNKVIRAGRERAKRWLSKPFFYNQHESK
jgi:hypothetical protein